jgi:hypothetical protein
MATGDHPTIPLFEDGDRISAAITAAVTSGTFVGISATLQGGPLLNVTTPITGGNAIQVATCTAAAKAFGVAVTDGATAGDVIGLITGHGYIVPMIAGGSITAGVEVECGAAGNPVTLASGKACGMAVSTATSTNTVWIKTY